MRRIQRLAAVRGKEKFPGGVTGLCRQRTARLSTGQRVDRVPERRALKPPLELKEDSASLQRLRELRAECEQ